MANFERFVLGCIDAKICKQILVWIARLKALDEIYKIYTLLHLWNPIEKPWKALLHRSEFKIRLNFGKHVRIFAVFSFKFRIFSAILVQNSPMLMQVSGISSIWSEKIKNSKILKLPEISQRIFWNFQKIMFEKLEKI